MSSSPVVGIFVGGRSLRMGGRPKGLLVTPERGEPIVERLVRVTREALGDDVDLRLVGRSEDYAQLGIAALPDTVRDVGPLGGLLALLEEGRQVGAHDVIALACDLPRVSPALVRRLARHSPGAAAVAPRSSGFWQPLFARYACVRALPAARAQLQSNRRSLQRLLETLAVAEMPTNAAEAELLVDWDRPEDVE